MTDENQQPAQPETVEIISLDDFVRALVHWHGNQVAILRHMLDIPEGTEMTVNLGEESGPRVLTIDGDTRLGFIAGLMVALSRLGELPFVAETDGAANDATPSGQ